MSKNLKNVEKFAKFHAEMVASRASKPQPTAQDVAEFDAWLDEISAPRTAPSVEGFELNPVR